MALQPCRECGQQVSTQAVTCPHCGAPMKPLVPASSPEDERSERELCRKGNLVVTTQRFRVGGKTYAIRGITSVAMNRKAASGGRWLLGCGFLMVVSAVPMILEPSLIDPNQRITGLGVILVAAALLVGGYLKRKRRGPEIFSVSLRSASGEQTAFSSTDELLVREIIKHLNQAIAARD